MRHGTQTLVITTTEQANAFMEHLEACHESAKANNYAKERAKPIKWLECTCCGGELQGRTWWNQEPGYGLCDRCVPICCGPIQIGQESSSYGVAGIHFMVPDVERSNPPLVEDRGEVLYGIDSRLRIEYDGYVYWKGRHIEHFSGSALYDTEENKATARELIRRCEALEGRGEDVDCDSVIWRWQEGQ